MEKNLLMGIDIGTSGCKLTVFDFDGQVICSATQTYKTYYSNSGHVEQDAEDWWNAVCQGIRSMGRDVDLSKIASIGVDGHSWACLPVDKFGIPLCKAMIWLDRRSVKQAERMTKTMGEDKLIGLSGNPVDPAYIVPKMMWLRENQPEVYRNAYKFLQSNSYIVYKLTGEYSQDYSQGYGFHFFNISKGVWDENTAEGLNISLDLMPKLFHCHEIVGTVTRKGALDSGLCEGTPVAAGGLDAACCTLGAGVIKPGQAQEQGGQAGGMSIQVGSPTIHPKLILGYHVIPGQWLLQGGSVGGGGTLKWFNEQLGAYENMKAKESGTSPFEIMSEEASEIPPGSGGLIYLPYMAGERSPIWDSNARGVFFGLSYDKNRSHMIRAMMEGVGYSLMHNLLTAGEAGACADELISVGGSSNSRVWTQIKSDITNKTIHVPFSDYATPLGAAILAGVGIGVYKSFEDAVPRTVRIQRTHTPNMENHMRYNKFYELYIELYEKLKDSFGTLNKITNGQEG